MMPAPSIRTFEFALTDPAVAFNLFHPWRMQDIGSQRAPWARVMLEGRTWTWPPKKHCMSLKITRRFTYTYLAQRIVLQILHLSIWIVLKRDEWIKRRFSKIHSYAHPVLLLQQSSSGKSDTFPWDRHYTCDIHYWKWKIIYKNPFVWLRGLLGFNLLFLGFLAYLDNVLYNLVLIYLFGSIATDRKEEFY